MLAKLFDSFFAQPRDVMNSQDGPLVFAALLIRVACADGVFDANERQVIEDSLADHYALAPDAVSTLMTRAEELEASAPDTVRFTRVLKESVPLDERSAIMMAIWRTILADGARDPSEDSLARMVAALLGIDDVASARARQKAQAQIDNQAE